MRAPSGRPHAGPDVSSVARSCAERAIVVGVDPHVRRRPNEPEPWIAPGEGLDDLRRPVGADIVDDRALPVRVRLSLHAAQRLFDELGPVVGGDDDGDERLHRMSVLRVAHVSASAPPARAIDPGAGVCLGPFPSYNQGNPRLCRGAHAGVEPKAFPSVELVPPVLSQTAPTTATRGGSVAFCVIPRWWPCPSV